jgi:glycosyltransferase involved in cell wall biosynthesis
VAHTSIISIVTVVDARAGEIGATLRALHAVAHSLDSPFELVLVANGCAPTVLAQLRTEAATLDNLQIYVLKLPVDHATALVCGLENAIGDWVATLDLEQDDPAVIGRMQEAAIAGAAEVALGVPEGAAVRRGAAEALLAKGFHAAFRAVHGYNLADEAPSARLLSRAVVNNVLQHDFPLVAFETVPATGGYRKVIVPLARRSGLALPLAERVHLRWRTLIGLNAAPLRIANAFCAAGAGLAFVYSVYVIVVYLMKESVVPGWTTVSLMLSGMFFMLSAVLWLLSEYLVLVLDAGARRARYEIGEEFASNVQTRRARLNVETEA